MAAFNYVLNRVHKISITGQEKQKEVNATEQANKNNGYRMDGVSAILHLRKVPECKE
jgi:hypothetical protein